MELIERYIQAVRLLLPADHRTDILAEMEEDIRSQVEEREAQAGRKLTDAEISTLLKQRGSPLKVAASYGPRRWLIGPELFPVYWMVLRLVLGISAAVWVTVWAVMMGISAQYRAEHAGVVAGLPPADMWGSLFSTAAVLTLMFAVLERVNERTGLLDRWEPAQLPAMIKASAPKPASRLGAALELALGFVALGWWIQALNGTSSWQISGMQYTLQPLWHPVFWALASLAVFGILMSLDDLLRPNRPRRQSQRAVAETLRDLVTVAVMAVLAKAPALLSVTGPDLTPERAAELTRIINTSMAMAFTVAAVVIALVTVARIGKLIYQRWARSQPGAGSAASLLC